MTDARSMIRLHRITKRFPGKTALHDVSFTLGRGETTAVTGANGSGKSTLLRTLGGLAAFDEGTREVIAGNELVTGYAPDRFPRLKFSSADYLRFMGMIRGIPRAALESRIRQLHLRFGLDPSSRNHMRHFSKGMLQKVNLMQAVLQQPELLLLDEPLSGLDAGTRSELAAVLEELKAAGVTIVLTTHETELAERLADRVARMADGRLADDRYIRPSSGANEAAESPATVLCRLPAGVGADRFTGACGLLAAARQGGLHRFEVAAGDADALLLAVLTAGGSIVGVTRAAASESPSGPGDIGPTLGKRGAQP